MKITNMEAEVLLEALPEEDCRFDHNRDCQEHGFFGIEGNCPVAESKELISTALKGNAVDGRPVVSDEAVQDLHERVVTEFRRHGQYTLGDARAALEAVMEYVAPRPVIDREALDSAAERVALAPHNGAGNQTTWLLGCLQQYRDAVMELARPMPKLEALERALADLGVIDFTLRRSAADAVLALLNGSES